jgi:VWFA-related protein
MVRQAFARAWLAGVVVAVLVAWPAAQQKPVQRTPATPTPPQQPVFKSASELVEVDAVVTDKSGAVVRGLTRDDFTVSEDDKPQQLVQFSYVDIPLPEPEPVPTKGVAPTVESDVSSNTHPTDSRVYVIVLDGFHVDPSRSNVVRNQARQFVQDNLGPNDLAAVLTMGHGTANQQFTSNKSLLVAAIDQFIGQKSQPAELNKVGIGAARLPGDSAEDPESGAKAMEVRIALESIAQLCQRLGTVQGHRRSVILFSEGSDIDTSDTIGKDTRPGQAGAGLVHDPAQYATQIQEAERAMFEAAQRANVALYTVDPRGNTMGEDVSIRMVSASALAVMREVQRGQGTLRTFAYETGGLAVVGTDKIADGFARITQANSSYYVLGYIPANTAHDGTYRKITVTLKPPHLDVVARKGYYAVDDAKPAPPVPVPAKTTDANAPSPRMRELLASQLPVSGLGLHVTGGPLRSQGDKTLVALIVEIDTKALPFTEEGGQLANDIEMAFQAVDATGKTLVANRQLGKLRLPASERSSMTNGLRYVVEFLLPPGRAQVRVGVHESAGDGSGSALMDIETVDLSKVPLSVGTIVLTTSATSTVPTTGSFPMLKEALQTAPTTTREFATTDTLVAFANVSDADTQQSHTIDITTVVQGADGREMFRKSVSKPSDDLAVSKNGFGYVSEIPLSGLAPGHYALTIGAKATTGKTASRALAFVVR